jgi:hypothetical protein
MLEREEGEAEAEDTDPARNGRKRNEANNEQRPAMLTMTAAKIPRT